MHRRLFGTDGVRGIAGEFLSPGLAAGLGHAATSLSPAHHPRVLIVRDTRESGPMLQDALARGVAAAGGVAELGGVLPTPAVPLLIDRDGFDLGVVISASHNLYRDNGIKFFGPDRYKLSDEEEEAIEAALAAHSDSSLLAQAGEGDEGGAVEPLADAPGHYLAALQSRYGSLDLAGLDLVLDCANGATHEVGPAIFRRLGAKVTVLADKPDGRNINDRCGSTHIEALAATLRAGGHDLGFAFDGDGDRVLAVDRNGTLVDGDELIALAALHLREQGLLAEEGVVVTVMSNYGFHRAMAEAGIEVVTTAVGDRYVLEELRTRGWRLGGEQSGHVIDMPFNRTGDGIATALLTLEALDGRDLADCRAIQKLPQVLVNVPVRDRTSLGRSQEVLAAIAVEQESLAGRGRLLVRPSGTEPLVRVMVEAPSDREARDVCARLVSLVEAHLG